VLASRYDEVVGEHLSAQILLFESIEHRLAAGHQRHEILDDPQRDLVWLILSDLPFVHRALVPWVLKVERGEGQWKS
jgi:hypothetical protein